MGEYRFPEGDAAAIRALSLARICRDAGHEVIVAGKGTPRSEDLDPETGDHRIEGIRYLTMNPGPMSTARRLREAWRRLTLYPDTLRRLRLAPGSIVIVNASSSARHVPFLMSHARKAGLRLVADVCEWYDPRQMKHGRLDPAYLVFTLSFRHAFPRIRNMIVVSRLLERHFADRVPNILRIAAPFDVRAIPVADRTPPDRVRFLYAGIPGRKDMLKEILLAMRDLPPALRARIDFQLLGPSREDLQRLLGDSAIILDELTETVTALGRVPHDQVIEAFHGAHFTVLIRPNLRYANAGYPSKVAESLAAGAPLFLNLTSDLAECLGDGRAAVIARDCTVEGISDALQRALSLSAEELRDLRVAAREKAERFFDYRQYGASFGAFAERLK